MTERTASAERAALRDRWFPRGVPPLWAPTLVFYREDGTIDRDRLRAHLGFMTPHVGGVLVGSSTGDAWEMKSTQILELLDAVVPVAQDAGTELLVGILRPTTEAMTEQLEAVIAWASRRAGTEVVADAFATSGLKGITLAPPTSSSPLSQTEIGTALATLLARGLPVALYQLPQVTGNLMQPELVADLATRVPNLLLFKDSSGMDEVARSGVVPAEVTLLRGG
jgi:dihydrodipicolinate synthase/N-acetylneuraminate lyase